MQDGVRGALPLYRGVSDAVTSIVRQEGWRSLYAGLTPALVGAGAHVFVCKITVTNKSKDSSLPACASAFCGGRACARCGLD